MSKFIVSAKKKPDSGEEQSREFAEKPKFIVSTKKKPDSGEEQSREFAEKPDTGEQ